MEYLNEKLTYTNYSLIDSDKNPIMMDWETDIMKESAKVICSNGGDILNIGFGMGIIDQFIQNYSINSHTIIECHVDVISKMSETGWFEKKNVNIIHDLWQNKINDLGKFDGVYYDTWCDDETIFEKVHLILKRGGIFSFFNGQFFNPNTKSIPKRYYDVLKENFHIDSVQIPIDYTGYNLENIEKYWTSRKKKYWVPVCIRK
jgi:protein arginine N-methyltransferase 2